MRAELKYLIPNSMLEDLRLLIAPYLKLDSHIADSSKHEYSVRSLYFDTSNFLYYNEKKQGLLSRRKIRVRGYDNIQNEDLVFLEIKRKNNNLGLKNRAQIQFQNLERFISNSDLSLLNNLKESDSSIKFLYNIHNFNLKPRVLIVYEREPYQELYSSPNNLRITFDLNVRSKLTNNYNDLKSETGLHKIFENNFILEIKFNHFAPLWLISIIKELSLVKRSISKYTISLDRLHFNHYSNNAIKFAYN